MESIKETFLIHSQGFQVRQFSFLFFFVIYLGCGLIRYEILCCSYDNQKGNYLSKYVDIKTSSKYILSSSNYLFYC